jgi:hypothetical protein
MAFEIKNEQVKEHYEYLNRLFHNQNLEEETRKSAHRRMDLLEALVRIYERDSVISEEDIDDLKISARPVFPEEMRKIKEKWEKEGLVQNKLNKLSNESNS